MRKIVLSLLTLHLFCFLRAQSDYTAVQTFASGGGEYTIVHYKENIYEIIYKSKKLFHDEQVSDAVVLNKPRMSGYPFEARVSGDTVYIRNRAFVIKAFGGPEERGFVFPLRNGERIFGGGERALPLNRRGYRLNLYNSPSYGYSEGAENLNYSVPFITSSEGYGLFFDNPSKGYLDIGKADKDLLQYGAASGELNVFVILGSYQEILQSYYRLTGTQPLPPRWAFGNLMSRFGYTSQAQVTEIAQQMKKENMPFDAVIFDLFWFGDSIKGTMGNLDWMSRTAWPDPKAMIGNFKKEGIHSVLVTEPFFLEKTKNFAAAQPYLSTDSAGQPYRLTDFYFGPGGLVDIFRPDVQQWFWQFYKKQIGNGVDGWWSDLGEPEKHPADLYHHLTGDGYDRRFRSDEVHNLYGHTWTKMLHRKYEEEFPHQRLFSLNRSGFAGSQRYSILPWTGDVSRSWSGLRSQLQVLLGMSMSGVPYVHSDAGGFAGGQGDAELYIRWLQFAVYTPVFRPHGTALFEKDPGAFSFPSEPALIDKQYRNDARGAVGTRYMMLPYNYSLAYRQAAHGEPLMSPLYYYFPLDTAALRVEDEFMWGKNLLVAPVLEKGAQQRSCYLPAGNWFDLHNFSWRTRGWHDVNADLREAPVFLREGGFMAAIDFNIKDVNYQFTNTAGYKGDSLLLTYAESANPSSFELYDDDGRTKESIASRQYELVTLRSSGRKGNHLALDIVSNGGRYPGRPAVRHLKMLMLTQKSSPPARVLVNGKALSPVDAGGNIRANSYMATSQGMILEIDFKGQPVHIEVVW